MSCPRKQRHRWAAWVLRPERGGWPVSERGAQTSGSSRYDGRVFGQRALKRLIGWPSVKGGSELPLDACLRRVFVLFIGSRLFRGNMFLETGLEAFYTCIRRESLPAPTLPKIRVETTHRNGRRLMTTYTGHYPVRRERCGHGLGQGEKKCLPFAAEVHLGGLRRGQDLGVVMTLGSGKRQD